MNKEENNLDYITVAPIKGLYMDSSVSNQPEGTYPYAQNYINRDQYQRDLGSNEHSDRLVAETESEIVSWVYQDEEDRIIYLLQNESLWYQDLKTNELHKIVSSDEFKCSWPIDECEEDIEMRVYTKGCDSYIQWSSKWIYYIVNISEMLNPKRKQGLINEFFSSTCDSCNMNCNYFKVFKPKCPPTITTTITQKGGGLAAGTYLYSARLITEQQGVSNWSIPSRPCYIYSEHNSPGENANGKVNVNFANLDCNYTQIEIAVTYYSGSGITTRVLAPRYFSGDSYNFSHIQTDEGDFIELAEILSLSAINLQGKGQYDFNGKMYYYAIRPNKEYNIQSITNDIKVRFYTEKYSLDLAKKYQVKTLPRGETVAFGLWLNNDDGTSTLAGHIPCTESAGDSGILSLTQEGDDPESQGGDVIIRQTTEPEYRRTRTGDVDSVSNPLGGDALLEIEKALVESYTTEIADLEDSFRPVITDPVSLIGDPVGPGEEPCTDCPETATEGNQFANVRDNIKKADLVAKDLITAETIAVKWGSILSDLIGDTGKNDLVKLFTPSNLKQVSLDIINAVKRREVIKIIDGKYEVTKTVKYDAIPVESDNDPSPQRKSQFPGGKFLNYITPKCYEEKDTKYPCTVDCDGNLIFGKRAGKNVTHNKIPNETQIPYYQSKSVGVPSKFTPDADEYKDGYVIVIGAEFDNINIDHDDYYKVTGKKLCKKEPYTIGQVKLTDANKTILLKGLATGTYKASNQGKDYIYQNLGVNSFEKCDKYIDIEGSRMAPDSTSHNSVCVYSLDQEAIEPYVGDAEYITTMLQLHGIGARHNLYAKGIDPSDKFKGRRIDIKGTVQSVNLSKKRIAAGVSKVAFAKYVEANDVIAPSDGGDTPLMNKFQQACLWVQGKRINYKDKSFVGDGLIHAAPITEAIADYVVLSRNLDNQYGPIENLSYIPILKGSDVKIRGLVGNRFISPYSFVKTSFVSDRVGDKFNIAAWLPSKAERCICDTPEDSINVLVGKHIWTELPESGDKADAKNWANLHTPTGERTKLWEEANAIGITESDMYYPGTLTTLITFWGEWETNPWGVEISDQLEEQRYPFIRAQFHLGSHIPEKHPWDDSYLDQFHIKIKQPSELEKMLKILIKSFIDLAMIAFGINDLLTMDSPTEAIGDIAGFMGLIAIWLLLSKVLFTDDFIDGLINIPKCKPQAEGGIDFTIEKFFRNWNRYSFVYSLEQELLQTQSFYKINTCCNEGSPVNDIHVSDPQIELASYNGFTYVRPNNMYTISNNKGSVIELFESNGGLYANTTDGIYSLILAQTQIDTNTLPLISGSGNIFNPQLIVGSNPEGYAGIISRNHAINTQAGRFQLDYEAGILYSFIKGPEPISFNGVYNHFKNNTKYINEPDCRDQYYSLGYDPRLHRVLITKFDVEEKNSWTLSYDVINKNWISFHTYFPKFYVQTRTDVYHVKKTKIYIHDNLDYTYGRFMDKEVQPTILDIKHISRHSQYQSHILDTDAHFISEESIKYNQNLTADSIGLFTSRQTSGMHNLTPIMIQNAHSYDRNSDLIGTIQASYDKMVWKINELYDYTEDTNSALINYPNKGTSYYELTNGNDFSNVNVQNSKGRVIKDNWFVTRLIYNNTRNNIKLYFRAVSLAIKRL